MPNWYYNISKVSVLEVLQTLKVGQSADIPELTHATTTITGDLTVNGVTTLTDLSGTNVSLAGTLSAAGKIDLGGGSGGIINIHGGMLIDNSIYVRFITDSNHFYQMINNGTGSFYFQKISGTTFDDILTVDNSTDPFHFIINQYVYGNKIGSDALLQGYGTEFSVTVPANGQATIGPGLMFIAPYLLNTLNVAQYDSTGLAHTSSMFISEGNYHILNDSSTDKTAIILPIGTY